MVQCPRCGQSVSADKGCYATHSTSPHNNTLCRMSKQHLPIDGDTPTAHYSRAVLVGNLAAQLRDEDPAVVWDYLETLSGWELQRIAMIALAAVPVESPISEIFDWVTELPGARLQEYA